MLVCAAPLLAAEPVFEFLHAAQAAGYGEAALDYLQLIKARGRTVPPHATLFYQLAGSAVLLLGLAALTGESGITRPAPVVLAALAYQGVVIAFASYLAWFWLLARYPAAEMAAFTFWTPLFGLAAGALLLGEPVTAALALAFVLVAGGIYLVSR